MELLKDDMNEVSGVTTDINAWRVHLLGHLADMIQLEIDADANPSTFQIADDLRGIDLAKTFALLSTLNVEGFLIGPVGKIHGELLVAKTIRVPEDVVKDMRIRYLYTISVNESGGVTLRYA